MDKLEQTDVLQILTLIRANYDNAYANTSDDEAMLLVKFWYESLVKYPRSTVLEATKNAIRGCQYAPRLANIIAEIDKLNDANQPSDEQLWAELSGVLGKVYNLSRYLIYPEHNKWANDKINAVYDSLSEQLKLFVVNPSTLIEISEMPQEALAYEKARFFKRMPTLRQHSKDAIAAREFLQLCEKNKKD